MNNNDQALVVNRATLTFQLVMMLGRRFRCWRRYHVVIVVVVVVVVRVDKSRNKAARLQNIAQEEEEERRRAREQSEEDGKGEKKVTVEAFFSFPGQPFSLGSLCCAAIESFGLCCIFVAIS